MPTQLLDPQLVNHLLQMQLGARRVVQGATIGSHRSLVKGASVEFRQHRLYVPGDEVRRLDWRVLGRSDRTYVKEYEQETNLRCLLLLDGSGSMAYGRAQDKFTYAARLAASLAFVMHAQTESVGLAVFNDKVRTWLAPRPGTGQLSRVVEALERTTPQGPSAPAAAIHEICPRLERRSLVIILGDFFTDLAPLAQGFAHLKHDGHEVIAMQVIDPDEAAFPFSAWTCFRGLEGEQARTLEPALVRREYLRNFTAHQRALGQLCGRHYVELARFGTDQGLLEALRAFLQNRQVAGDGTLR